MSNQRRRTRVGFHALASVKATGVRMTDQETRDLSLKGVFLLGSHPLKQGDGCFVTIYLQGEGADAPALHMEGKVARSTEEGTGIDFVSMDPETYLHLRNLIILNADDPNAAEKEMGQPAFDADNESD